MNKNQREIIKHNYILTVKQSWTFGKMTETEQKNLIGLLEDCEIFGNTQKQVYTQLHNINISFLYALGYKDKAADWRENENSELKLFSDLFSAIINNNEYYDNIRKAIKRDENFCIYDLVRDYNENATFISVYYYLDSIEDWLKEHKNKTVYNALDSLWETGMWKE